MEETLEKIMSATFEAITSKLETIPNNNFFFPIGIYPDSYEVNVIKYGQINQNKSINTESTKGVKFIINENSNAKNLFSITSGLLRYKLYSGLPTLILQLIDPLGDQIRSDLLPKWFPKPQYAIYNNIDQEQTSEYLNQFLENDSRWFNYLRELIGLILILP